MAMNFGGIAKLDLIPLVQLQAEWADRYPGLSHKPALVDNAGFEFGFGNTFPPVRIWAENESGTRLVQSQNDRLILNWRKQDAEEYPGYDALRIEFQDLWDSFAQFLSARDISTPSLHSAEYTYVNAIDVESEGSTADVLSVIELPEAALPGSTDSTRLQMLRTVESSERHPLPAQIQVSIEPQNTLTGERVLLTVTTRALADAAGELFAAMDAAHALSSHTFTGVTSSEVHEQWGRKQ